MRILRDAADQQLAKPLRTHGWDVDEPQEHLDGEYLLISVRKSGVEKKVALVYTTAMSNAHYRALDGRVDIILANGALYQLQEFAYGISTPIEPISDFFSTLVQWNKGFAPDVATANRPRRRTIQRHITAERPLDGIWARLDHLASMRIAERLIRQRASADGLALREDLIQSKATGLAFAVRSASDYFRTAPHEALNKRILSLYYGTLAFAFADMLASPKGPGDLDEVEGMTKQGHGLYTVPSATQDFGSFNIGVLASGFFPQYAAFLGYDTSAFPKAKPKTPTAILELPPGTRTTLACALGAIPELAEIFLAVFDVAPSWLVPGFDWDANPGKASLRSARKSDSTYITLLDPSKRISLTRITDAGWPLAEAQHIKDDEEGHHFQARIDHPGCDY